MKQIKAVKTSDGQIFEDANAAAKHERSLQFNAWYDKSQLTLDVNVYADSVIDSEAFSVSADDVASWLDANKKNVQAYFNGTKAETRGRKKGSVKKEPEVSDSPIAA